MDDKLQAFYQTLKSNPNITGLPDDYATFSTVFQDPNKGKAFYQTLTANPNIKGLPQDYDMFASGLGIGATEEERIGFVKGLGKSGIVSLNELGRMGTATPQGVGALVSYPSKMIQKAIVNKGADRAVELGKISDERANEIKSDFKPGSFDLGSGTFRSDFTPGENVADSPLNAYFKETAEATREQINRYDNTAWEYLKGGDIPKAIGAIAYGVTESLAPSLAAAFIPGGAAALGLGVGSVTYDEVKDRENMTETQKMIDAVGTGVFEWFFEKMFTREMGKHMQDIFKAHGPEGLQQALTSEATKNLIGKAFKRFGVWFSPVSEGVSEALTSIGQNAAAKYTGEDPDRNIADGVMDAFLVGMGMGTTFSGVGSLAQKLNGRKDEATEDLEYEQQRQAIEKVEQEARTAEENIRNEAKTMAKEGAEEIMFVTLNNDPAEVEDKQKYVLKDSNLEGKQEVILYEVGQDGKLTGNKVMKLVSDLDKNTETGEIATITIPVSQHVTTQIETMRNTAQSAMNEMAKSVAGIVEGDTFSKDGISYAVEEVTTDGITVTQLDENGNITDQTLSMSPDEVSIAMQSEVTAEQTQEATEAQPEADTTIQGQEIQEGAVDTPIQQEEAIQYPRDKEGNVDYSQITEPITYGQALKEEFGDDSATILDEYIKNVEEEISKVQKGKDPIKKARDIRKLNEKIGFLQNARTTITPEVASDPTVQQEEKNVVPETAASLAGATERDRQKVLKPIEVLKAELADMKERLARGSKDEGLPLQIIQWEEAIKQQEKQGPSITLPTKQETTQSEVTAEQTQEATEAQPEADILWEPQFQVVSPAGFYSTIEKALESIPQVKDTTAKSPEEWKKNLLKFGAKQAELDWMGWDDHFPDAGQKVSKAEIQDWIDQNRIEVEEVEKSSEQFPVTKDDVESVEQNEEGEWVVTFKEEAFGESIQPDAATAQEAINNAILELRDSGMLDEAQPEDRTRYSQYTTPGGENYKEVLLTMPDKSPKLFTTKVIGNKWFVIDSDGKIASEPLTAKFEAEEIAKRRTEIESGKKINTFKSSHFDEPNILAHIRFNERTDSEGNKVLFIEELQSDWAQQGKKEGFTKVFSYEIIPPSKEMVEADNYNYTAILKDSSGKEIERKTQFNKQELEQWAREKKEGVPDMPFKKTDQWVNLALRRMMRYATENGFDRIAWANGSMQNERYDLSKQVDEIRYNKRKNEDLYDVQVIKNGQSVINDGYKESDLESTFGKDISQKIISNQGEPYLSEESRDFIEAIKPQSIRKLSDNVFGTEMTMLMPLNQMDGGVLTTTKHNQVRESIISFLPVNVMNILNRANISPSQLFENDNMVTSRLPIESRETVAIGIVSAIRKTGALMRTELSDLGKTGREIFVLPTLKASDLNSREVAGIIGGSSLFHLDAGFLTPEKTTTARSITETLPVESRNTLGREFSSAELANFLNIHNQLIKGDEDSLQQRYKIPSNYQIKGDNLKIEPHGMKAFYDAIIPNAANKLGKPFNAKVEDIQIDVKPEIEGEEGINTITGEVDTDLAQGKYVTVQSIPVTKEMREGVKEGVPLFQFMGEKGAKALDNATEASIRLDNLRVAREMEGKKVGPKTIKVATGWERGADGKWRYEIPDGKLKMTFDAITSLPMSSDNLYTEDILLKDILDNKDLFSAYPELNETKIVFYDPIKQQEPTYKIEGFTSDKGRTIAIGVRKTQSGDGGLFPLLRTRGADTIDAVTSVLSHEIQHLIQRAEGFADGGNKEDVWRGLIENKILEFKERDWYQTASQSGQRQVASNVLNKEGKDPVSEYRKLAGEVEARNVETRQTLTPEQRKSTLAKDTEDITREDQVFITRSLETALDSLDKASNKSTSSIPNDNNWQDKIWEQNENITGDDLGIYERHQDREAINGPHSSYHFTYEPGLRHIYANPTAYDQLDEMYKRDGYLPEGYIENHFDQEDFKLKEGYVAAIPAKENGIPNNIIGGAASDKYAMTFIGDKIADIYDGKIVKVIKPLESWEKTDGKYEKIKEPLNTPIIETISDLLKQSGVDVVTNREQINEALKSTGRALEDKAGIVYGFVLGEKIYLDPALINPNSQIHEYTHLWDMATMRNNPELWESGKVLMKQLDVWREVVSDPNYANISKNDDLIASEVHARLTGKEGPAILKGLIDSTNGNPVAKVEALSLVDKIKAWLKRVYESVFGKKTEGNKPLTLEEWNAMPVRDLIAKRRINEKDLEKSSENTTFVGKSENDGSNEQQGQDTKILRDAQMGSESGSVQETHRILAELQSIERGEGEDNRGADAPYKEAEGREGRKLRAIAKAEVRAKESGAWINLKEIKNNADDKYNIPAGQESEVYVSKDGKSVIKLNNLSISPSVTSFLYRIEQHNKYSTNTAYEIIGFSENSEGELCFVLKQPFINNATEASRQQIEDYFKEQGWHKIIDGEYTDGNIEMWDVHPRNVLTNESGDLFFIDVNIDPAREEFHKYKPTETPQMEIRPTAKDFYKDGVFDMEAYINAIQSGELATDVPVDMVNSKEEKILEVLADKGLSLKKLQDEVVKRGGTFDKKTMEAYMFENLTHGMVKTEMERFDNTLRAKLAEQISNLGLDYKEVNDYLKSKHIPERNAYFMETKGKEVAGGLSTQEAEARIAEYEKRISDNLGGLKEGNKAISELWSTVNEITDYTLDAWRKYGYLSKEGHERISKIYKYYVPLRGFADSEVDGLIDYQTDDLGKSVNPMRKAKGRTSEADDPIQYMVNMAYTSMVMGAKNRIKQRVARMVRANSEFKDLFRFSKVYEVWDGTMDEQGNMNFIETSIKPSQEMFDNGHVKTRNDTRHNIGRTKSQAQAHEVQLYINGEKYVMIMPRDVASFLNKEAGALDKLNQVLQQTKIPDFTRWLANNFTSKNPAFIPINMVRDLQYSALSHYIQGGTAQSREFAVNLPKARKAIIQHLKGRGDLKDATYAHYVDFLINGGETGYIHMQNVDEIAIDMNKAMARLQGNNGVWDKTIHSEFMRNSGKWLENMAIRSENLSRFATYLVAIKQGKSKEEAAYAAKNTSVNFNRKGKISSLLGGFYAFFNASVQGGANIVRLAKGNPKAFVGVGATAMAMGFMNAMLSSLWGDDDDDELVNRYRDGVSNFTKYNNLVILVPGTENAVTIPLPHGFRWFHATGVMSYELLTGQIQGGEALKESLSSAFSSISPVDAVDFIDKEGGISLRPIVPTVAVPWFDISRNETFAGYPVHREPYTSAQEGKLANVSLGQRSVNPIAQRFTNMVFWLGGGDPTTQSKMYRKDGKQHKPVPDIVDINPSDLEHTIEYYLGGRGKFWNNVYKTVSSLTESSIDLVQGDKNFQEVIQGVDMNTFPVVRRLVQQPWDNVVVGMYYNELEEIENYKSHIDLMAKSGAQVKYAPIYQQKIYAMGVAQKRVKDINDRIKGADDKKVLERLEQEKERIMRGFIEQIKSIEYENN